MGGCLGRNYNPSVHSNSWISGDTRTTDGINRIFIVGNAGVGKSTLVKQIQKLCTLGKGYELFDSNWKTIHPFSNEEKENYKNLIIKNVYASIRCLITLNKEKSVDLDKLKEEILEATESRSTYTPHTISPELAEKISKIWTEDSEMKRVWEENSEGKYKFMESTDYFLQPQKLKELSNQTYLPSPDDILRLREPTTQPTDFNFEIQKSRFSLRDAGGHAEERKHLPTYLMKWLGESGADDKNFILFVASLSDYNKIHEDFENKTMMDESIQLLCLLLRLPDLKNCGFLLFLNKRDLLLEQLASLHDFTNHFHFYIEQYGLNANDLTLEQAEKIIAVKFAEAVSQTQRANGNLYTQFTCAIDTGLMEGIFAMVKNDITRNVIKTC